MNLTHLSSPPASVDDTLTPDDDLGCTDCGDTPCDCDTRCPDCHQPYRDEDEQARGQCTPCYGDALDSQRDDCGGEAA